MNFFSVGGEWWFLVRKGKEIFGCVMDVLLKKFDYFKLLLILWCNMCICDD